MNSLGDALRTLARAGGRVLRGPSAFVLVVAAVVIGVLAVLVVALLASPGGPGGVGAVLLAALPLVLATPVVLFALRRRRWLAATEEEGHRRVISPAPSGSEVLAPSLADRVEREMRGRPGEEDVRAVFDAVTEAQVPGSQHGAGARLTRMLGIGRLSVVGRALGRVDQAQRALLTAAGGPVNAPYLKDDLRVTLAAALGTFVAIPVAGLTAIVIALVLLSR